MEINPSYFAIQEVLFRFMRAFDNKDWDDLHEYLLDNIRCDYSSFRAEKPAEIARNKYIEKRKADLSLLKTQHNLSNLSIDLNGKFAVVKCNFVIYRFHPKFEGSKEHYFHSYGQYEFELHEEENGWKISAITQKLLVNDGNPELHGATRRKK